MFSEFYVRAKASTFLKEWEFFRDMEINPEIYIDSNFLNDIGEKEKELFSEILKNFSSNTLHAPFLDISTGGVDCDIRDLSFQKLKKTLQLGRRWKSHLVVVHYNFDNVYYREYRDLWLENSSCFFKNLLEYSPPPVAIENIADPDPDIALKLEKKVNSSNLIHCFDFGHHRVFGKITFKEWLSRLGTEKHLHFHFHDNTGDRDDHLPLGKGDIHWDEVKSILSGLPNDFSITLEPHSRKDLMESLKFYREFFL